MISVETFGNSGNRPEDEDLSREIKPNFDLRPEAIIERFDLRKPIYYKTAQAGHFTDPSFPWEKL